MKPNNCCYIKDRSIVVIEHICKNAANRTVILGRKFIDRASFENYPIDSREVGVYQARTLSNELQELSVHDIEKKTFRVLFRNSFYIFSILHTHYL